MSDIALNPQLVAELKVLDAQRKIADERFSLVANAALLALGLDPTLNHALNLDTGVLTPAKPQEGA